MIAMPRTLKKPKGKIDKPEDREWREWFSKLGKKDHERLYAKLGLTDEDEEELEEVRKELKAAREENTEED